MQLTTVRTSPTGLGGFTRLTLTAVTADDGRRVGRGRRGQQEGLRGGEGEEVETGVEERRDRRLKTA